MNDPENIKISDRPAINELTKDQERCLNDLLDHILVPFETEREWWEWQRRAIILQLNQTNKYDTFYMHNKALWSILIGNKKHIAKRKWAIMLIHNHLVHCFASARKELFNRETTPP